jgi:transposase
MGVPQGLLGTRLLAFMALLVAFFRRGRRRIRDFMSAAFGIELSVGLADKGLKRVSESLAHPVEEARARRKKAGVSYVDDTGWFERNRASHVWVNDTGDLVLYQITPSRDTASAKDVIGEDFNGELVSDRAGSFTWFPTERRQVCWAHLKRQFQGVADGGGAGGRIGVAGVELSNRLFSIWHKYKTGEISREQMQRRMRTVEIDAGSLLEEGASCTDVKVSRFCKNLLALGPALFSFSREEGVEPTNNTAERDLRPAVIWRKLSFGTQSSWGSRLVERLLTVVSTLKRQGRSVLEFFQTALSAKDRGTEPPSLLPGKSRDQPVRA